MTLLHDRRVRIAGLAVTAAAAGVLALAVFSGAFRSKSGTKVADSEIDSLSREFIAAFYGGPETAILPLLSDSLRATPTVHRSAAAAERERLGRPSDVRLESNRMATPPTGAPTAAATFRISGTKGAALVELSFVRTPEGWRVAAYDVRPL